MNKTRKNAMFRIAGIIAIIAIIGLLVSCPSDNGGQTTTTDPEIDIDEIIKGFFDNERDHSGGTAFTPSLDSDDPRVPLGQSEDTFVGYGINVFDGPSYADAWRGQLLSDAVFWDASGPGGGNRYIVSDMNTESKSTISISDKITDAYSKLEIGVEVKTGKAVPFFSGGVNSQFSTSEQIKSQTMFYNAYHWATTRKHYLKPMYVDPEFLGDIIEPNVLKVINSTRSPETIFRLFGTHIITQASIGGNVNVSGLYNTDEKTTEQDLKVALDFETPYVSGGANVHLNQTQKNIASNTNIATHAIGGSVDAFAGITSIAGMSGAMKEWAATIGSKPNLARIHQTVPIWELASDPARKSELENAFYANAGNINEKLMESFQKGALPTEAIIVNGGIYVIANFQSHKVIDVEGQSTRFYACLVLQDKVDGRKSQQWEAVAAWAYPGYFFFRNVNSSMMMEADPGSANNPIIQNTSSVWYGQLFKITESTDGTVLINSKVLYTTLINPSLNMHGYVNAFISPNTYPQRDGMKIYGTVDLTGIQPNWKPGAETKWKLFKVN